jgi:hypothetical protein
MERKLNGTLYYASVPLCLWFSLPAMGQDCQITGRVLDAGRAAVATAVVTVTRVDSGLRRQVLSNAQGYFQLTPLSSGTYRIEAVKPGFKRLSRTLTGLNEVSPAVINLQMETAEVSDTITLEARQTGAGSLLAYICGLSAGSCCETIQPVTISSQTDSPFFP